MELILQQGLPHQQKAIDAVCDALEGVQFTAPVQYYENPLISLSDPKLYNNLRAIQAGVPAEYCSKAPVGNCLNLDIKMETGTGKTYVYTKTIFELHKRYGINKFIIAVPSLAIKAGAAQFLQGFLLNAGNITAADPRAICNLPLPQWWFPIQPISQDNHLPLLLRQASRNRFMQKLRRFPA